MIEYIISDQESDVFETLDETANNVDTQSVNESVNDEESNMIDNVQSDQDSGSGSEIDWSQTKVIKKNDTPSMVACPSSLNNLKALESPVMMKN